MNIPGLQEGLVCLRIGVAGSEEYEVVSGHGTGLHMIRMGPRGGSTSQIIVAADKGYQIRPAQFDIREYERTYEVVRLLDAPETIEAHLKFTVQNAADRDIVKAELSRLKTLPGYRP